MVIRYLTLAFTLSMLTWGNTEASESPNPVDNDGIEEIVVTGSRLPRRDYSAVSPIATIDRATLEESGQATLEETLKRMPQLSPGYERTSNGLGSDGAATIDLRALGAGRTLVLLNGRRVAPTGTGSAVDINNLPQALMERVEIITGGATTVYGADAVAGVVNFITREDFEGFGIDTSAYVTEAGDSNIYDINVTYGHDLANGRGNITLFGGYYDRESTLMGERDFTRQTYWDWWDGTVQVFGSSQIPEGIVHAPQRDFGDGQLVRYMFDPEGNPMPWNVLTDFYDFAPINYLQVPLRRKTVGGFVNLDLTANLTLYSEALWADSEVTQTLAPVPLREFVAMNVDNPALTPQMQQIAATEWFPLEPGIAGAVIGRRLLELGPRTMHNNSDYLRLVAGVRGAINEVWDFDAWLTYTDARETDFFLNDASFSRFQQGLLVDPVTGQCFDPSGGCVPVNPFGLGSLSPEAIAFIRYDPFQNDTTRTQKGLSAFIRGAPIRSWAGPIHMAFGVEYRSDEGQFHADPVLFNNDTLGYVPQASVVGKEEAHEFYTELSLPLLSERRMAQYAGLEMGARFSDYEHAGGIRTWKFGGEWQVNDALRFRVMRQRAVRAPNLDEAFTEQGRADGSFSGNAFHQDPCSAPNDPIGSNVVDACVATGLPVSEVGTWTATLGFPSIRIFGGNPEVSPETADTLTAGIVLDIDWLSGLRIAADYFDLRVRDTIGELDVRVACFDEANVDRLFCDNIRRDPLTLNVIEVFAPYINRGRFQVRGIDLQLGLGTDLPDALSLMGNAASLDVSLVWTHTLENSAQETAFGTVFDCAGLFGDPCLISRLTSTYPKHKANVAIRYIAGDFQGSLNYRWIDGMTNGVSKYGDKIGYPADIVLGVPDVDAKGYLDLGLAYRLNDHITARLNVMNVTETDPPLMADWSYGPNTESGEYDVFGRAYTLSLQMQF